MKGIMASVIVLLAFLSALLVAIAFAEDIQQNYDVVSVNAVNDRIFYKFSAIENSIIEIIENDLENLVRLDVREDNNSYVTINFTLPSRSDNFVSDLLDYESFAEIELNETTLFIDLELDEVRNCFPLTVWPYNISYGTEDGLGSCGFGNDETTVRAVPNDDPSEVLGYYSIVSLIGSDLNVGSASWTPAIDCTGGTLNWTISVTNSTTNYGPISNMIDPAGSCVFTIDDVASTQILSIENKPGGSDPDATLEFTLEPGFNASYSVTMELLERSGKTYIGLPPQSINLRETLFQIEKNGTVLIQ